VDIGQQILQIVFTVILARLLTKADFGLVAMALLVTRFIRMMTQVGFGTAIIQDQNVNAGQISAIFYFQIGINLVISLLCFLGAPLAATFFHEPQLLPVVQVLAWTLLISSFTFPQILLIKQMRFGGYSILEMGSMIGGNIVGIAMAIYGFGVWALVWRLLIQRLIYATGIWPLSNWRPCRPCFTGVGRLFKFGLHMLGSNIFYYFSQNMAAIIIGKFIGVETLGVFNIAYNLAIVPAQKIQSILTSVLTPAFATIQRHLDDFRAKFRASLFSLSIIYFPLMLGLAAVAQNFVIVVYGEKWREAGLFLTFLAVVGMLKGTEHLLRSIIIARGWSRAILGITAVETGVSLPLLLAGLYFYGIVGLIVAYVASSIVSFILTVHFSQKAAADHTVFFKATARSLVIAVCMFVIVLSFSLISPLSTGMTLCFQIVLGAIFYVVVRYYLLTPDESRQVERLPFVGALIKG